MSAQSFIAFVFSHCLEYHLISARLDDKWGSYNKRQIIYTWIAADIYYNFTVLEFIVKPYALLREFLHSSDFNFNQLTDSNSDS